MTIAEILALFCPGSVTSPHHGLTHHFIIQNKFFGGLALAQVNNNWIYCFIAQADIPKLESSFPLPSPYNNSSSLAVSYISTVQECYYTKASSYVTTAGSLKEYFICGYNNKNSSASNHDNKRSAKSAKEHISCASSFNLTIIEGLVTDVQFKEKEHSHSLDKQLSNIILPSLKTYLINESLKPLCFLDRPDIEKLINNYKCKYPELDRWPTSIKTCHKFARNQASSLFGDTDISIQSQMINILNHYHLKDGLWGNVADSGFYMAFEVPGDESPILWAGSFLNSLCIRKLAECANGQMNLDGTFGTAKYYFEDENSKKIGSKTDLYLLVAQAPDMVLPLGAFLSKSDKISAVKMGLELISGLYCKIGVKLYGRGGIFSLLMSDKVQRQKSKCAF